MSSPYDYPEAEQEKKPPAITAITVIAALFAVFMVAQVYITIGEAQGQLEAQSVQEGERISYHYSTYLPDGTLYETTQIEVAEHAHDTEGFPLDEAFSYAPKRAVISTERPGLGWGPEADRAVIGARVGQTVTFDVPAEHGPGDWEPFTPGQPGIPREIMPQAFQRTVFLQEPDAAAEEGNDGAEGFDLEQLENSLGPIEVGGTFNADRTFPPSWDIEFIDVNRDNRSITFRHTVEAGQYFDVPDLPGGVTVLLTNDETELVYRFELEEGSTFVVQPQSELNQAGFSPGSYLIDEVTDEYVALLFHEGMNPDAVGQPLSVRLTVLEKLDLEGGTSSSDPPSGGTSSGGQGGDGHTGHDH